MAFLAISSSPVSLTSASIRSTSTRRVTSGGWAASVPGGERRGLRQAFEDPVDRRRHRLGVAGEEAGLQQSFQVVGVERPALVAQHIRRYAAGRSQRVPRRLPRRLREQQLLRLENAAGRWPTARRSPAVAASASRCGRSGDLSDAPRLAKRRDEIVRLGIGVGRDLAGGLHLVEPRAT